MMLVKLLSLLFAIIPDPLVMLLSRCMAPFFLFLSKKGKWALKYPVVIPKVFPDREDEWHRKVIKENSVHLMKFAGELLKARYKTRPGVNRKCYIKEGKQYFEECLGSGEGFIIITCHLGNWEYAAAFIAQNYQKLYAPVFVEDSSGNRALNWMRERRNVEILETGYDARRSARSLLKMIEVLNTGGIVFLVADQEALSGEYRGMLFGKELGIFGGPFILGQKTGKKLLPHHSFREKGGKIALCFDPQFYLDGRNPKGDIARVMEFFERHISEHPGQYIWSQDRW
jgi:KDO2-lipid IV(A) lauroyltransferase